MLPVIWVRPAPQDRMVRRDLLGLQARRDRLVQQVQRDQQGTWVRQDSKELLVQQAPLDQQVFRERPVSLGQREL